MLQIFLPTLTRLRIVAGLEPKIGLKARRTKTLAANQGAAEPLVPQDQQIRSLPRDERGF